MEPTTEDWQRLGKIARQRRISLGFTQQDLRAEGGPSTATLRLLEGGLQSEYTDMVLGKLETSLRWEPGSVAAILAGGEPTKTDDRPTVRTPVVREGRTDREIRQEKIARARAIIREAVEDEFEDEPDVDVDDYRFEERVARIRRLLAARRDRRSAAELDEVLKAYESDAG